MNPVTRSLAVLGLAVGVVAGSSIPASATFSDTAAAPTMSLSTVDVAAPGNVVGSLTCGGRNDSTMRVTWTASTSARVSGYRVTVHFSDGFKQHSDVGPSTTSWSASITTYNVTAYSIRYTVTTNTAYGWEKESVPTGSFQC